MREEIGLCTAAVWPSRKTPVQETHISFNDKRYISFGEKVAFDIYRALLYDNFESDMAVVSG
jgi:hypothetical protein